MAEGMMFVCAHCGLGASSPVGWIVVEDTRGGSLSNQTGHRWRLCSWACHRGWAASFEREPLDAGDRFVSGVSQLVGGPKDG